MMPKKNEIPPQKMWNGNSRERRDWNGKDVGHFESRYQTKTQRNRS